MKDFLNNQDKEVDVAYTVALKKILRLLNKSKMEIIGSLTEIPDEFQQVYLLKTLKNIDLLIDELYDTLGVAYTDVMKNASTHGYENQLQLFEAMYGDKLNNLPDIPYGPIELKVLTMLEMNTDSFLMRFTESIREQVKNTIQQSLIHGRTQGETIQMIRDKFNSQLASTKRAVHHIYLSSYNSANYEVLEKLQKGLKGVKKQWWSFLDKDTTHICKYLHGQIRSVDDSFVHEPSGSKWAYPPAVYGNPSLKPIFHFCRSRVIPYMEGLPE